jgi:hypothetical protein
MTPEGRVKKKVKELLDAYKPLVKAYWPVQNGMGSPMLDCVGSCCGLHFEIETKAKLTDELTPRQQKTRKEVEASLAPVFVIRAVDDPQLEELEQWLYRHVMEHKRRNTWSK